MPTLMHLSDLHFGAHDPLVCAAATRLAHRLDVGMVVVSGDLTQRATQVQFAQADAFVRGLGAHCTLVLAGNHDLPLFAWWLRWGRAYQRFHRLFGDELEPVRHWEDFYVVGVNTTRAWRHERGSLSSQQILRVAEKLQAAPAGTWRLVVSHHPLVASGARDTEHRPSRADEALAYWHAAGAHMVLSGHVHQPALLQPLPGLWAARGGTAVSHRLRHGDPQSVVVLTTVPSARGGGAPARWAARWDYDQETGEFAPVHQRALDSAA